MIRRAALPLIALLATSPALAAPGGVLGTLPIGRFTCETGGDVSGPASNHLPELDFAVVRGSSYDTPKGAGTYLLVEKNMVMTSGPMKGRKFHRISPRYLRELDSDGKEGPVRCIKGMMNYP